MATVTYSQTIWINGYVFNNESKKIEQIPFATILFCDYNDHSKICYVGFSDMSGMYDLGKNVEVQKYFLKILAPGYQTRTKSIGDLPESFKGNMTLHFFLNKATTNPLEKTVYNKEQFEKKENVLDCLSCIPKIKKTEDSNILTESDESVKLMINGLHIPQESIQELSKLPSNLIDYIEYYNMSPFLECPYKGIINIVLNVGNKIKSLDFTPSETQHFDIK